MADRPVSFDYSEVADFSVKSLLAFNYVPAIPHIFIDGTDMGVDTELTGIKHVVQLFEDNIAAPSGTVPILITVKTPSGAISCTRDPVANTLSIGARPPVPFARAVALKVLATKLGY